MRGLLFVTNEFSIFYRHIVTPYYRFSGQKMLSEELFVPPTAFCLFYIIILIIQFSQR